MEAALQCEQLLTEESSGRGSDGDCGCPTGRSVPSMFLPPTGWDETWRNPQILQETGETDRERGGEDETAETSRILFWCKVVLWEKLYKRENLVNRWSNMVTIGMLQSDEMWR